MILFHGSKGGLTGDIKPRSRKTCDFGSAFYMGMNESQTKELVVDHDNPVFYVMDADFSDISSERILRLSPNIDWLNIVLYNRGYFSEIADSDLCTDIKRMMKGKDMIIGPIADAFYSRAIEDFINDNITANTLIKALNDHPFKNQFAIKSEKICRRIRIIDEIPFTQKMIEETKKKKDEHYEASRRHYRDIKRSEYRGIYDITYSDIIERESRNMELKKEVIARHENKTAELNEELDDFLKKLE